MSTPTLRGLSRKLAAGDIDRETYRRRRRELIEAVVSGAERLVPFEEPEPQQPTVFPDDDDGDTTQEIIPPVLKAAERVQRRRRGPRLLIAAVLLAALAGLTWWLLGARPPLTPSSAPRTVPNATTDTVPSADVIERFVRENSWTSASLSRLAAEWATLDADVRDALRDSDAMRRLTDGMLGELASERALVDLGDAAHALARQGELFDLARRLGLDDARLRRARDAWQQSRDGHAPKVVGSDP